MKLTLLLLSLFALIPAAFSQSQTWKKSGGRFFLNANTNFTIVTNGAIELSGFTFLTPTAADGSTPFTFDTSTPHTSGNLLEVKNNGTNKFALDFKGSFFGPGIEFDPGVGSDAGKGALFIGSETTLFGFADDDGTVPYIFGTSKTHSVGDLVQFQNNGTNVATITPTGAITTGNPGAGSGAWKLGTKVIGVSVALVITNYVEVNIGGTVVKLAIVQ